MKNRGFLWSCYSTTFGACIHEIGHILDLGHSTNGIMGLDFNNIHSFFISKDNLNREIKWWTSSEIYILSHHKWLNNSLQVIENEFLQIINNSFIKSNYGIVVIEYRQLINNQIINSEVFTLPAKSVKLKHFNNVIVFVMDINGNIIKQNLI